MEQNHNNLLKPLIIELYDVPPTYHYKTQTQGDHRLSNPYASICGISTLAWSSKYFSPADITSGFFARFLIFTPPCQDNIPDALPTLLDPQQVQHHNQCKANFQTVINTLDTLATPRHYTLSAPAYSLFTNAIHPRIYALSDAYDCVSREITEPYKKRWSPYVLKIAMLLRLFENSDSTTLSESSLLAVEMVVSTAAKDTLQLFTHELGLFAHRRKCEKLYVWLKEKTLATQLPVARRIMMQSHQLDGDYKEYDAIVTMLIESGRVQRIPGKTEKNCAYMPLVDGKPVVETNFQQS